MRPFQLAGEDATALSPGPLLLEASAGTGKTYTITGIVSRLILEAGLPLERIALLTFTRAATGQLADRLRARLAALRAALLDGAPVDDPCVAWLQQRARALPADERRQWQLRLCRASERLDAAPIATIHAFAQRLARQEAALVGIAAEFRVLNEPERWRERFVHDWFRSRLRDRCPWVADLLGNPLRALRAVAALSEQHPRARCRTAQLPRAHPCSTLQEERSWLQDATQQLISLAERAALPKNRVHHPQKLGPKLAQLARWLEGRDEWPERLSNLWQDEALDRLPPAYAAALRALRQRVQDWHTLVLASFHEDYLQALLARCQHSEELAVGDCLLALAAALRDQQRGELLAARLGARYDALLIDEFQDTDQLQWEIIRRCFLDQRHHLVLIGDPKQAIYGFRGADVYAYTAARAAVPPERRFTLTTNHRSDLPLIEAINQLYLEPTPLPQPFGSLDIAYHRCAGRHPARLASGRLPPEPLQLWTLELGEATLAEARERVCAVVAAEIARLLDPANGVRLSEGERARPLQPRDIAVLVRTHAQAEAMHAALRARGIAAVRRDRSSVFGSEAATALRALLAASLEPGEEGALRRALATRLCGCPAALLADPAASARALAAFGAACAALGLVLAEHGPLAWWYELADLDLGWGSPRQRLAHLDDGGRLFTDVLHLVELLAAAPVPAAALPTWLAEQAELALEGLRRLERDDDAVAIATVHASKGLEWPVVFEAFAWGGLREPEPPLIVHRAGEEQPTLVLDDGDSETSRLAGYEALSEDLRLLYVALTRARHRLYLIWAPHRARRSSDPDAVRSALAWLLGGRGVGGLAKDNAPWEALEKAVAPDLQHAPPPSACIGRQRVGEVAEDDAAPPPARAAVDSERAPPPPPAPIPRQWTASSFTALCRRWQEQDAGAGWQADDEPPAVEPADPEEAPRGPRWGDLVHRALAQADLAAWAGSTELIAGALQRAAKAAALPLSAVQAARAAQGLQRALAEPLPGLGAPAALPPRRRSAEWPVQLAVPRDVPLAPLLTELALEPAAVLPRGRFTAICDLLAIGDDGRWHIVDWKTNLLPSYERAQLARVLRDELYLLQGRLYLAALHRFLALRLGARYDPDRHLGRAWFVFVRCRQPGAGAIAVEPAAAWLSLLETGDA
ncbi:MAG: UvrD-helicase domain-containing protein [Planctomycetes bacterium]|nr:UvrD-helicase domain-containing protein [Planctomycetota bacterium]